MGLYQLNLIGYNNCFIHRQTAIPVLAQLRHLPEDHNQAEGVEKGFMTRHRESRLLVQCGRVLQRTPY